jgi:hypothetical protein
MPLAPTKARTLSPRRHPASAYTHIFVVAARDL